MEENGRSKGESLKILGIDEAGRGAVIGPLVICGLVIDERKEDDLRKLGVKDSKELTPKKRVELVPEIERLGDTVILSTPACKIDANRRKGVNLNQIEAIKMAEIINIVNPDKVIIDCPSYNSNKFRDYLWSKIDNKNVELVCENFADKNYPVVSGASVVAKVHRDKKIRELEKKIGEPIGVGYPHHDATIKFLKKLAKENNGKMPRYVRHTWDTVEQIVKPYKQRRILSFLERIAKRST